MTASSLGDILIGAAADVVSHDYLRHNLALEAENLEGGGGGGDSKGEDVSVGERLFENGGGGGADCGFERAVSNVSDEG